MLMAHAALAATLLLPLTLPGASEDPQQAFEPQRDRVGPVAPGERPPQDLSWYPYEELPPFVGELLDKGDDGADVIHAGSAVFTVDEPPAVPRDLTKAVLENGELAPGYFLVHFEEAITPADKAMLDDVVGPLERPDGSALSRWYVPNNTYAVWIGDASTLAVLEADLRIDWIGRYEPAYKLDPTIGSALLSSPHRVGRATYQLSVDLMPGHPFEPVAGALQLLGANVLAQVDLRGEQTYDVRFLVVEAAPALVTRIALIEGVRTIQEDGDGVRMFDVSGGGKLQNRTLAADDGSASPIITASSYPLWLTRNLQGQGQIVGVVDTSFDWNNVGTSGCGFGYPDTGIDNWGMALPNTARVALNNVTGGGVNLKIPRADTLGGATLQGTSSGEHGAGVAGAACADFYGNNDNKWWEHDPDNWEPWAPSNYSGLLGPGIAHEAQLYATPVLDNNGGFRWETPGEFPSHMTTTLTNMENTGVCASSHSVGLAESNNTYTQTSVAHDTVAFDQPNLLQCMAAGNDGAVANALTSQAVVKNALTVGASDDVYKPEDRVSFSSIGPRFDGALKPDIMAPGSDTFGRTGGVQSLLILPESNGTSSAACSYQYTAGTSFSAPTMTGATALIHQYFEEGNYSGTTAITDPSAALMKAMIVNAGTRLTGALLGNGQYPNEYQGWGEPNLSDVLDFGATARDLIAVDVSSADGFNSAGSANDVYAVTVDSGGETLKVSLVWTDEPGSSGQGKKLVNDLDLTVQSPGGATYRGNVINGSTGESTTGGSADTLNNVENVILNAPSTGSWTITVNPGAGNYSVGQGYALVVTGDVSEGGGGPTPPTANFSGNPLSGDAPLLVSFSDLSSGAVDTWSWTFGDGGTSNAQNPSHNYTTPGTYDVSLTVTGPGGADGETKTGYVTVTTAPVPPVANFSGNPLAGNAPLLVNFSDLSSGDVSTWSWTFGDGGSSNAQNPSHSYTSAGTYDVSLTVTGPGGADGETKNGYVTVTSVPMPPVAEFSGTPLSGNAPLLVSFNDQSSGAISTWSWTFGDGGTSNAQNPNHTYTSAGTYDVSLTVTGPDGADGETKTNYITVTDPPVGGALWYLSFTSNTSVPGVGTVADEDVVTYAPATGTWAMYFDGSDVGVGGQDVNAVHVLDDGTLVLSFTNAFSVPGLTGGPSGTTIDDSDIVLFAFTSSGSNTSGSFQFIFDGSDVGLTSNGEDIDGVYEFPGGGLAISTTGGFSGTGASGADEDVMLFTATQYGATTIGSFARYFDGSDVGFGGAGADDLNAVCFDAGSDLLFSTVGTYVGAGSTGADEDVSRFSGTFGNTTSGTAALELDLSALGISTGEDVDGLCFK